MKLMLMVLMLMMLMLNLGSWRQGLQDSAWAGQGRQPVLRASTAQQAPQLLMELLWLA
jgi:hypothetical protein